MQLKEIRQIDRDVQVIFLLRSLPGADIEKKAYAAGASDVIRKDFSSHFMFKRILEALQEAREKAPSDANAHLGKILVVDDSQEMRLMLTTFLRNRGFSVSEAANGDQAVMEIKMEKPALVLLDERMPGMDGLELLAELHGQDPELPVLPFPDWETLPYDRFSPHPDIISQRLSALNRLPTLGRGIVVVPIQTLMQRLPPVARMVGSSFDYKVGQRLDLDAEKRRLEAASYRNVPQVQDPGDFAVRGGLLDVFPMGAQAPLRIELFDETIDTIRAFDPDTQRSLEKTDAVRILPGREVPLDPRSIEQAMNTLRERFDVDTRKSALYQDLKSGIARPGWSTTCRCSTRRPPPCSITWARRRCRCWPRWH